MSALLVLTAALTIGLLVLGFAVGARKLLGIRVGPLRSLIAGCLGFAAAGGIPVTAAGLPMPAVVVLQLGVAVLVTMAALTIGELLVPGRSPEGLPFITAVGASIARVRRYWHLFRLARRHNLALWRWRHKASRQTLARDVTLFLQDAGVTFVKFGQLLSTRRDLMPAELVAALSSLQSNVAACPYDDIVEVLEDELGARHEELFAEFQPEPIAAASIAQVYGARLFDGTRVAVTIQRPGIAKSMRRDLAMLERLARTATRWVPSLRQIGLADLVVGFRRSLEEELDFRTESANIRSVQSHAGPRIHIPMVFDDYSTARVMTMEFLEGTPVSTGLDLGEAADELYVALLTEILRQITAVGVFHADPHPGNVLVLKDGMLGLLDFGVVGRLDPVLRSCLAQFFLALQVGDRRKLKDALLELLRRPDALDDEAFERALGQLLARHIVGGAGDTRRLISDFFRIVHRFGFEVSHEMAAVFRCLVTLDGTLGTLCPNKDVIASARGLSLHELLEPQLDQTSVPDAVERELAYLLPMLRKWPQRADRLSADLEAGRLSINVRFFADDQDRKVLSVVFHRLAFTALSGTTGIMGCLLLVSTGGPRVSPSVTLPQLLGYNLLLVSAGLLLCSLIDVRRSSRS